MRHLSLLKKLRSVRGLIANEGWKTVMVIAVSACLFGENCKYNGGNNYSEKITGMGVFAQMVSETSIKMIDVEDLD